LVRGEGSVNRNADGEGWYEAGHERAAKKCSQALREGTCAVVRKTLEESILSAGPGSTVSPAAVPPEQGKNGDGDIAKGLVSQSNTVTPTLQLEERADCIVAGNKDGAGTKRQNAHQLEDRESGSADDEEKSCTAYARDRLMPQDKRGDELAKQESSNNTAKMWDNWRKRPRAK
jgi:hypothetical protein